MIMVEKDKDVLHNRWELFDSELLKESGINLFTTLQRIEPGFFKMAAS